MSEDQSEVETTLAESLEAAYDENVAEPETQEALKPEQEASEQEISAEGSEESSTDVSVEAETEAVETGAVIPPEHWAKDAQETFVELDERGREFALSQEKNFTKGLDEKSAELKTFRDAFEPYKHLFPAGSEPMVIQQLLNAQSNLQQNPVESIKWLMKNLGVDEKQFAPSAEATDEFQDPEVAALRAELKDIKDTSTRNSQAVIQRQQIGMIAEINQFRDAAEDGKVLHPHFDAVSGVMAGLMQSGRAETLEEAYKQALWSEPEYRDSVIQEQAEERAKKVLEERTREADKAKKAAATVTGANASTTTSEPKTLTDSLNEAYDKSVKGEL